METSAMPPYFWRIAYVAEFLLAIIAVLTFWGEVGGEGHLDLMPWYAKFGLSAGLALAVVTATISAASEENPWNAKTLRSVIAALLIAGVMAAITYYYHVHENDEDETGGDDGVAWVFPHQDPRGGHR
jgi:peptidoglycan/LPS O-acetylase OafA/YrhL